jgi:hypothetical protein
VTPVVGRFIILIGANVTLHRQGTAENPQLLIRRYREELFTFLSFDGIPWNGCDPRNARRNGVNWYL